MLTARQNTRHAIATYLSVVAIAHLLWETLQLPLYTIWLNGRMQDIAFAVVHCTVGDIMIAGLSLLAALVVLGARTWPAERFVPVIALTILIGAAYTVFSEWLCAPKARTISEGGSHPESCRLIWKLASGSVGQLAGSKPRDKGRLGRLSDPAGRNSYEARAGLESDNADADPPAIWGRQHVWGSNRRAHPRDPPG